MLPTKTPSRSAKSNRRQSGSQEKSPSPLAEIDMRNGKQVSASRQENISPVVLEESRDDKGSSAGYSNITQRFQREIEDAYTQEIAKVKADREELREQNDALRTQLDKTLDENRTLTRELQVVTTERDSSDQMRAALAEHKNELEGKVNRLEEEVHKKGLDILALKADVALKIQELQEVTADKNAADRARAVLAQRKDELEGDIRALEADAARRTQELQKAATEKNLVVGTLAKLYEREFELEQALAHTYRRLMRQVEEQRQRMTRLEEDADDLAEEHAAAHAEARAHKAQLAASQRTLHDTLSSMLTITPGDTFQWGKLVEVSKTKFASLLEDTARASESVGMYCNAGLSNCGNSASNTKGNFVDVAVVNRE